MARRPFLTGLALVAAMLLAFAASGGAASADPQGFNGTVKVHDGDSESEPIRANEPHVGCNFHLHGFGFDASSSGTWRIEPHPPTTNANGGEAVSGTWGQADANGNWRTGVMSLPAGHYKLSWDQTKPSAPGGAKHKVFWVECAPQQQPGVTAATPAPTTAGGAGGGAAASPTTAGVQQPPAQQPGQAIAPPAAPVQQAPVAGIETLPSTSTDPSAPLLLAALIAFGLGGLGLRQVR